MINKIAVKRQRKTKKGSYAHLLSHQSKIFYVTMKNIEVSLTGHRRFLSDTLIISSNEYMVLLKVLIPQAPLKNCH